MTGGLGFKSAKKDDEDEDEDEEHDDEVAEEEVHDDGNDEDEEEEEERGDEVGTESGGRSMTDFVSEDDCGAAAWRNTATRASSRDCEGHRRRYTQKGIT